MRDGLLVKFHPGRLSDEDLSLTVDRFMSSYDTAPRISEFMVDAMQGEQLRRLKSRQGTAHEAAMIVLPAATWSAMDLTQGLLALTAMSYGACSEQLGKLLDTLVRVFTAAVGGRAVIAEDIIRANIASQ